MTACAIATPRSGKGPRLGASLVCPTLRRKKTAEGEPFLQLKYWCYTNMKRCQEKRPLGYCALV